MNGEIRATELRVISESGEQLGVMSRVEALAKAEDAGLDLIEISPNATPPVAKIIDWGKYQYQKVKEQQRNKRSARASEVKQMRLGLKIGRNDLEIKLRKIREFLGEGNKVKIQVIYRGREMAHQEVGRELMNQIIELLAEDAIVEQQPQMAGRNLSIVIRSNNAKVKNA
ncbi:MAG: translation initiation factor IF-3 [Candidatus Nomurabacteria bacterium]|nr:translation initiation factor IF-3 [Candidatus Nomurabacteria bacterium]